MNFNSKDFKSADKKQGKLKKILFIISNPFVIFAIIIAILYILKFSLTSSSNALEKTEETRDKMGTYVNVVMYSSLTNPEEVIEGSYAVIDELSKILSNYDPQSSVSRLNNDGFIDNAPQELIEIISLSKQYNTITDGAFEITVDPVLKLWSEGLWKELEEVQNQKISEVLKLVGSDKVKIDGNTIEFEKNGMSVTLGGVAKGYIVDKMIEYIKENEVNGALVNAGGDIMALGSKPGNEKWTISLENPDDTSQRIATFGVTGKAVATSGNYYRYFDPSKEVHHIIDPRTGYSANLCISTTIIADSATIADILSTSVFVLGPLDGMQLVERLDNVEALIIDNEKNITKSSGMDKYILP